MSTVPVSWLGKPLSLPELRKVFPDEPRAGFKMDDKNPTRWSCVESVKVRFSRSSYNNEFLGRNTIAYVNSPVRRVTAFVEDNLMGRMDKPVRVHFISEAYQDYDGGSWWFDSMDELGTDASGNMVGAKRFILRRLVEATEEEEEATEEEEVAAAATPESPESPAAKRPRGEGWGNQLFHEGHRYDSHLEVQHARFLASLGLRFQPHPGPQRIRCTDPVTGEIKEVDYSPDMRLDPFQVRHGESNRVLYLEIKPCIPHMGELSKVEAFARQAGANVLLLHGNFSHGLPFGYEEAASPQNQYNGRHYHHQDGIRGMLFLGEEEEFRRVDGVVWNVEAGGGLSVGPLLHSGDVRWHHERLVAAYAAAA